MPEAEKSCPPIPITRKSRPGWRRRCSNAVYFVSLALGSVLTLFAAVGPASADNGRWRLTSDATQCAVATTTGTGTTLYLTYQPGAGVAVAFVNRRWNGRVTVDQPHAVRFGFDRGPPVVVSGRSTVAPAGIDTGTGYLAIRSDVDAMLDQFASAGRLTVEVDGNALESFDLTGSKDAVQRIRSCANKIASMEAPLRMPALTPLLAEEQKLLNAPASVKYYVASRIIGNFTLKFEDYARIPTSGQQANISRAYYLQAAKIAFKLPMDDSCASILNKIRPGAPNIREVMLEYEAQYLKVFGEYPDVVPVDTDSVTARLIERERIR